MEQASTALVAWIRELESEHKIYKFYKGKDWLSLREEVLEENHYECARCKAKGIVKKAVTVHHVNHVHDRPDLALSKTYIDIDGKEKINLEPLCARCHNEEHGRYGFQPLHAPITQEKW